MFNKTEYILRLKVSDTHRDLGSREHHYIALIDCHGREVWMQGYFAFDRARQQEQIAILALQKAGLQLVSLEPDGDFILRKE